MPRKCTVCTHEARKAIDEALVQGSSVRSIAGRFGLSKSAVARHAGEHIPQSLVKAAEAEIVASADDLLSQVRDLHEEARGVLEEAKTKKDLRAANGAIREALRCLSLLGQLVGELETGTTVNVANITMAPEWTALRSRLLEALAPFPEARAAAAHALTEGSGGR